MRRIRYEVNVVFEVPDELLQEMCPFEDDQIQCECGECEHYFFDRLKSWITRDGLRDGSCETTTEFHSSDLWLEED